MVESAHGRHKKINPAEKSPTKSPTDQTPNQAVKSPKLQEVGLANTLFRRSGGEIPVLDDPHGIIIFDSPSLATHLKQLEEEKARLLKEVGEEILEDWPIDED